MPYIPRKDRPRVASDGATNAGELNYELTLAIRAHLRSVAPLKYQHINDVVGDIWRAGRCVVRNERPPPAYKLVCTLYHTCIKYVGNGFPYDDVAGALECCKLEFYRRVAVPYEEAKIKLNGDCY